MGMDRENRNITLTFDGEKITVAALKYKKPYFSTPIKPIWKKSRIFPHPSNPYGKKAVFFHTHQTHMEKKPYFSTHI